MHPQTIAAAAWAMKRAGEERFVQLMQQTLANTSALADALLARGLKLLTGGTDCHMFVLDLRGTDSDGVKLGDDLGKIGIWVNSKPIPYDTHAKPMGIRAGCTVLTQRGMKENVMSKLADIIASSVSFGQRIPSADEIDCLKNEVKQLCCEYPDVE